MQSKHFIIATLIVVLLSSTVLGVTSARQYSLMQSLVSLTLDQGLSLSDEDMVALTQDYFAYMSQPGIGALQSQAFMAAGNVVGEVTVTAGDDYINEGLFFLYLHALQNSYSYQRPSYDMGFGGGGGAGVVHDILNTDSQSDQQSQSNNNQDNKQVEKPKEKGGCEWKYTKASDIAKCNKDPKKKAYYDKLYSEVRFRQERADGDIKVTSKDACAWVFYDSKEMYDQCKKDKGIQAFAKSLFNEDTNIKKTGIMRVLSSIGAGFKGVANVIGNSLKSLAKNPCNVIALGTGIIIGPVAGTAVTGVCNIRSQPPKTTPGINPNASSAGASIDRVTNRSNSNGNNTSTNNAPANVSNGSNSNVQYGVTPDGKRCIWKYSLDKGARCEPVQ